MLRLRRQGERIGFVPTMGALHEGHVALIRRARSENRRVVVSIFVNPTQFGPNEDYERYPRPIAEDRDILRREKVDYLFMPAPGAMYPEGFRTEIGFKPEADGRHLFSVLCGKSRPGHFKGVVTVVCKLLAIVLPHRAYFGAKDYQQSVLLRRMIRDLDLPVDFCLCPIVRDKDGLAISSRNRYLKSTERARALAIFQELKNAREKILAGEKDLGKVRREALKALRGPVDQIDYFEAVDGEDLRPLSRPRNGMVLLTACYVGGTRLIDNVIIKNLKE
ncbi:MAG: pantoate--beta-alanine ligase [Candidatus Omnitrophota bacterium]